jgi:hypothetical protein
MPAIEEVREKKTEGRRWRREEAREAKCDSGDKGGS